jgi:hypothetical protein
MPSIEMAVNILTFVSITGLILIVLAVMGGGLRIKELILPKMPLISRFIGGAIGCVLLAIGLLGPLLTNKTPPLPTPPLRVAPSAALPETVQYIVQAGSFKTTTTPRSYVDDFSAKLQTCSGVALRVVTNAEYGFLTPGKWIVVAGPYGESDAAGAREKLEKCGEGKPFVRQIR